jgi:hypothetical protein
MAHDGQDAVGFSEARLVVVDRIDIANTEQPFTQT